MSDQPDIEHPEYARLLRANLFSVFNERDSAKRLAAAIFVAEPVMSEPDKIAQGRAAIAGVAGKLLEQFGPSFTFTPEQSVGHHCIGLLHGRAGPADGPIAVTGTDVAEIVAGRFARLWVMLNPQTA